MFIFKFIKFYGFSIKFINKLRLSTFSQIYIKNLKLLKFNVLKVKEMLGILNIYIKFYIC